MDGELCERVEAEAGDLQGAGVLVPHPLLVEAVVDHHPRHLALHPRHHHGLQQEAEVGVVGDQGVALQGPGPSTELDEGVVVFSRDGGGGVGGGGCGCCCCFSCRCCC